MNPLGIGKEYRLNLPDGRLLGRVRVERIEDDWAEGPLVPDAAFAEFRDLFQQEASLRNDQVIPLWEQAADRIEALDIRVVGEDGKIYPGFRVYVDGNEVFLGPPLSAA